MRTAADCKRLFENDNFCGSSKASFRVALADVHTGRTHTHSNVSRGARAFWTATSRWSTTEKTKKKNLKKMENITKRSSTHSIQPSLVGFRKMRYTHFRPADRSIPVVRQSHTEERISQWLATLVSFSFPLVLMRTHAETKHRKKREIFRKDQEANVSSICLRLNTEKFSAKLWIVSNRRPADGGGEIRTPNKPTFSLCRSYSRRLAMI